MFAMHEHIVAQQDDAIRLDRWFKRHYPGLPHALLEKHLRKGLIRLDGKKAKSSDRLQAGQVLRCPELSVAPRAEKKSRASASDLESVKRWVLYKDANVIVVNKPFGLPVQGGNKIAKSLDDLLDGLKEKGDERPRLVHRLDRDTSGCLVLARSAKIASALMPLFASRKVEKTYLALVNNVPDPLAGNIDLPIRKKANPRAEAKDEGREYEIMQVDKSGQKAVSEYRVIEALAHRFALVELKPLTGRTHQLRVHMQAIGCPIVGDHKYGGATDAAASIGVDNVLHLHARAIGIPPLAGQRAVTVTAPLPEHMRKSFSALGIEVDDHVRRRKK